MKEIGEPWTLRFGTPEEMEEYAEQMESEETPWAVTDIKKRRIILDRPTEEDIALHRKKFGEGADAVTDPAYSLAHEIGHIKHPIPETENIHEQLFDEAVASIWAYKQHQNSIRLRADLEALTEDAEKAGLDKRVMAWIIDQARKYVAGEGAYEVTGRTPWKRKRRRSGGRQKRML